MWAGCAGNGTPTAPSVVTTAAGTATTPTPTAGSAAPAGDADLQVQVVATGLEVPWEMRFLPDGNLVVTERTGRIVRVDPTTGAVTSLGELPVAANGESGLLGLAIDPDFPAQPYLYVAYTHDAGGGGLQNRVSRLTLRGDAVGEEKILVDGIPAGSIHDGSRVAFGPDGFLWVTTGDAGQGSPAQDRGSLAGKVLRMDRDGLPAPGNPFPDSLVYSYGHRNPQGLAWLPGDPQPFLTEHGPDRNDEINHVVAGGNFGWPNFAGTTGRPGFVDPIYTWTPTIAPAGAVFYEADAIPGWRGSLLFVTLKEQDLRRLTPADAAFSAVSHEDILLDGRFGRLRSIAVGPDGALYLGTSNRDGRGSPGSDDDRILRVTTR
jgi:glucose/arabinose dehydrogenase